MILILPLPDTFFPSRHFCSNPDTQRLCATQVPIVKHRIFCSTSPSVQLLLLFNFSFCSTSPSVQLLFLFNFSFCSTFPPFNFSFCSTSLSVQLLLLYHIQSPSLRTLVPLKPVRVQEGTHIIRRKIPIEGWSQ